LTVVLFLSASSPSAVGQDTNEPDPKLIAAEVNVRQWKERTTSLIEINKALVTRLSDPKRALYHALLAKILWKHNDTDARQQLVNAESFLISTIKSKRESRSIADFNSALRALPIILELDPKMGARIVQQFDSNDDPASLEPPNDPALATMFAVLGLRTVRQNPGAALAAGFDSLRYGFASEIPNLVVELNLMDALLAEALVAEASRAALLRFSYESYLMAFNLNRYMAKQEPGQGFSTRARRMSAVLFADLLANAVQVESRRSQTCGIGYYAPTVAPWVREFAPERSAAYEQNLRICLANLSPNDGGITKLKADGVPEDVDDLLHAARNERETDAKLWLYREALYKLYQAKQFERIISILDGLDGDEYKKHAPIAWGNWRVRAGHGAAMAAFESGDLSSASRHVERTPSHLRPFVRERLASNDSIRENQTFLFETLNGMEKDLAGIEVPSHDAAKLYLSLADLYLEAVPAESEKAFAKAVKQINKWDSEQREKPTDDDWAPMYDYVPLNANLLAVDEYNMFISLRNISSPHSRIRITLGLLESSIKEYESANKTLLTLRSAKKNLKN
jgi:hypothetical protein